ncbi:hypothetical protein SCHPADRAFT_888497 [Schizopora paradoxa]|uniref:Uncharacterized protein n=1 Tax=Schizopora paradoxa TaxID=27342 RepID=A0A0H2RU07_9AGAM|nr:hypothetical protein SCHPADRAFT_888497 [Schizopora paradoxa]
MARQKFFEPLKAVIEGGVNWMRYGLTHTRRRNAYPPSPLALSPQAKNSREGRVYVVNPFSPPAAVETYRPSPFGPFDTKPARVEVEPITPAWKLSAGQTFILHRFRRTRDSSSPLIPVRCHARFGQGPDLRVLPGAFWSRPPLHHGPFSPPRPHRARVFISRRSFTRCRGSTGTVGWLVSLIQCVVQWFSLGATSSPNTGRDRINLILFRRALAVHASRCQQGSSAILIYEIEAPEPAASLIAVAIIAADPLTNRLGHPPRKLAHKVAEQEIEPLLVAAKSAGDAVRRDARREVGVLFGCEPSETCWTNLKDGLRRGKAMKSGRRATSTRWGDDAEKCLWTVSIYRKAGPWDSGDFAFVIKGSRTPLLSFTVLAPPFSRPRPISAMPVWNVDYTPSRLPRFNPRANLVNIANSNGVPNELDDLTDPQKVAIFDLLAALGLSSGFRGPHHLRDDVDLAYVRNKGARIVSEGLCGLLFEGAAQCTLMEHSNESRVFANVYIDSGSNYFESDQPTEAIERQIYIRLPGPLARIQPPRFLNAAKSFSHDIAILLPEFLNEKKRRAHWSQEVAMMAADTPFLVHVRFPPDVLRRPGLPPPGGNGAGGNNGDDGDDGPDDNNDGPAGNNDGLHHVPPPLAPPPPNVPALNTAALNAAAANMAALNPHALNAAALRALGGRDDGRDDDDEDTISDCSFTSEEWRTLDRLEAVGPCSENTPVPDEERHAEVLREALAASKLSFQEELAGVSLESNVESIASGSQRYPARHVASGSGAIERGMFVNVPPTPAASQRTPTTPSRARTHGGVWVFLPGKGSEKLRASVTNEADHSSHEEQGTPTKKKKSSKVGKGKDKM